MEFFDFLYLGIFLLLSPAFDNRFYVTTNQPVDVAREVAHAVQHFYHLFHVFSSRFVIVMEGEVVTLSYVVDRMLAEFAAAAVNFSRAIEETYHEEGEDKDEDEDEEQDRIDASLFVAAIEGILQDNHSEVFAYYSSCLVRQHQHFLWTGPKLQIHRLSQDILTILPLLTVGERLDLPSCPIYAGNCDPELPVPPDVLPVVGKRRNQDSPSPSSQTVRKRTRLL